MEDFDESVIRQHYVEAAAALSDMYRSRILTYGPDAARLLLRSFDDLGRALGYATSDKSVYELPSRVADRKV